MKNKWNILILLFIALVVAYALRGVFGERVELEVLREGSMEDMASCTGVVVKYETVYDLPSGVSVETKAVDGQRVANGETIAAVYASQVDPAVKAKLDRVNKKIAASESNQTISATFSGDATKLESDISDEVASLISYSYKRDMEKAGAARETIAALADRKAVVSGQKSASANTLDELKSTKQQLEAQIGAAQSTINAAGAGVFSATVDGLEKLITPYNMEELVPSSLEELIAYDKKTVKERKSTDEAQACKVIDNFRYFVAVNMPASQLAGVKKGDELTLRFNELSTNPITATVFSISAEENGQNTVVLEGTRYLDSLLEKRTVNVDVIKRQYKGYRVGVKSIRTVDGVVGVFVKRDSIMRFIPANILYNTQEFAIVESADKEKPLKLYDEVIVNASSFEDGKLMK